MHAYVVFCARINVHIELIAKKTELLELHTYSNIYMYNGAWANLGFTEIWAKPNSESLK